VIASSQDRDELELELPSEPTSVRVARHAVAAVARRIGAPEADVKLAVSEAVSNAVTHGFRDREPGTIMVTARVDRGKLLVTIADDGSGMRPNLESKGLGLGISLITKLAGDVRFDSSDDGLVVSMSFAAEAV
jgi:anti-sigma regulatory factor (Ser/Thr protein kinase)